MTDKYERAKAYKELRELHRLYNKCEPGMTIDYSDLPELAVCACGRILKRPGQTCWGPSGPRALNPGWVPITHRDKHAIRRRPVYARLLKELARGK